MSETIRLLIADDHKMVREGLKVFIAPTPGFEVVGEASTGGEAVAIAGQLNPDVILLDLMMPGIDGLSAAEQILKQNMDARIIMITSFVEDQKVIAAIKTGVAGFLTKDSSPQEIENAIRDVYNGHLIFPSRIASILAKEIHKPEKREEKRSPLNEREIEVLQLVAKGASNQEIADRLFLSVWTVRTYVSSIMAKLGLENRTQAALYALREGLAEL